MAIATATAILGAAAIGAGASVLGSSAQSKANNKAVSAQKSATAQQLQLGRESMALNRDIYNSNYALLSPWVSRGNVAGDYFSALLGLPSAPAMQSPLAPQAQSQSYTPASRSINPRTMGALGAARVFGGSNLERVMMDADRQRNAVVAQEPVPTSGYDPPSASQATGVSAPTAQQAFQQFANSAGVRFAMDEMGRAVSHNAAGRGALESGAAAKALQDRASNIAVRDYFMPYMGMLSGLSGQGAQAGSAVAGVGSNFGSLAAGINSGMGNAIANGAANVGNLYQAQGQNQANMFDNLGSSFGMALGGLSGIRGGQYGSGPAGTWGGWSVMGGT